MSGFNGTPGREVKRYDPFGYDGLSALMHEDVLGDYVRHEDYDALLAERDALREALKALRAATPSLTCESFNHERRDLHSHDEECPPFERWIAAALACNAALQGDQQ